MDLCPSCVPAVRAPGPAPTVPARPATGAASAPVARARRAGTWTSSVPMHDDPELVASVVPETTGAAGRPSYSPAPTG